MDRDTVEMTVIKLVNRFRMFEKSGGPASLATNLPSAASLGPWLRTKECESRAFEPSLLTARARADHSQIERQRSEASGETLAETTPQHLIQLSDPRVIIDTPEAYEVTIASPKPNQTRPDQTKLGSESDITTFSKHNNIGICQNVRQDPERQPGSQVPPTLAVGLGVAKPAGRGVNVFLRIGEDPSRVEYHLALPIRDGESVEVEGDADCQLVYERVLVCLLLRGNVFVVEHLVDMALTYPVMNLKLLVTAMEHPSMTSQHPKMASEHGGRQTRQNPQHQASRSFLLRIQ
ncbi:hypothetical protein E4U25_004082 [Claviceps purpurea]|nr:hypothetical protein E4U25_004082 [Claviceps purpurea]